jgi:hypothetical protein
MSSSDSISYVLINDRSVISLHALKRWLDDSF